MQNEELLCRHGSQLNDFTRALRDECAAKGHVLVRMRNEDWCKVVYVPADAEDSHPYDDCPHGGFRGVDSSRYWLANGESITGDRFDLFEFESNAAGPHVHDADISLDADTLKRLRRVLRLLGIESTVPEDDKTLSGALFSVLGRIADAVERLKSKD